MAHDLIDDVLTRTTRSRSGRRDLALLHTRHTLLASESHGNDERCSLEQRVNPVRVGSDNELQSLDTKGQSKQRDKGSENVGSSLQLRSTKEHCCNSWEQVIRPVAAVNKPSAQPQKYCPTSCWTMSLLLKRSSTAANSATGRDLKATATSSSRCGALPDLGKY